MGCTLALYTFEMVRIAAHEDQEFDDGVMLRRVRQPPVLSASLLALACGSRLVASAGCGVEVRQKNRLHICMTTGGKLTKKNDEECGGAGAGEL